MNFIKTYLAPIIGIISIALLFYVVRCEPFPTEDIDDNYPHELLAAVEKLNRELTEVTKENEFYKTRVAELEQLPPKVLYSTRIQTKTVRDTFTVTTVDSTATKQLQELEAFLASLDLDAVPEIPQPTYFSHYADDYITLSTTTDKDTMNFSLNTREEIVVNHLRKKRLFKPDEYTLEAYSTSPYTSIVKVQSVKLKERPRRVGISFILGYGASATQSGPTLSPLIGGGISYTPIKF
jgi:hypothetical protein